MELPEIETILRTLPLDLTGRPIVRSVVRFSERVCGLSPSTLRRRLLGAAFIGFGRRGKFMLLHLDTHRTLIWHLGMSGRVSVDESLAPVKHLLMAVKLDDGRFVKLYDARRFGRISLAETGELPLHPFFRRMARDYDDPVLTVGVLTRSAQRFRKRSVKEALLDQSFIAGLGNIYASEVLFEARVDPRRSVRALSRQELARVLDCTRTILDGAIARGGTSIRDYVDASGRRGGFQHRLKVYQREGAPCVRCGDNSTVVRIVQNRRSTFFCPRCQK